MGTTSKILTLLSTPAFPKLLYRRSSSRLLHLARHVTLSSTNSRRVSVSTRGIPTFKSSQLHSQSSSANFDVSSTSSYLRGSSPFLSEILKLVDGLSNGKEGSFGNYCEGGLTIERDELLVNEEEAGNDFLKAVDVCMKIARERPDALRLFSRKDLEVIVNNESPSLFKNGTSSTSRMKLFLNGDESKILESERAQTVDVMRYVLSYAYNSVNFLEQLNHDAAKCVDTSYRNIIIQLVTMSGTDALPRHIPVSYGHASRTPVKNIEMKPGDWICGKCSFMNFAKNSRCLECEEARPKRQSPLLNGEWECPQCDYYNYRRNMSCLRCDCKRPGESPPHTKSSNLDHILSGIKPDNPDLKQRLAANDEKAEKYFNKVSQLGDKADDINTDEDFPDLMPLRKGSNRFVVSSKKTPLERRLANSTSETSIPSESSISKSLDRILGRNSSNSHPEYVDYRQSIAKTDPNYVPFVPLPPDMFKKPENSTKNVDVSSEQAKSDNNNTTATGDDDDDFPEIMPMRKGENRFVVSKKKDRTLISPPYKKRMAMEQANQSDFIPFVPFPPDYFAKKDKQPDSTQGAGNYQNAPQNNTNDNWNSQNDNKTTQEVRKYESAPQDKPWNSAASNKSYGSSHDSGQGVGKYQNAPQSSSTASGKSSYSYSGKSLEGSAVTEDPDPLDMSEEAKAARWFRRAAQIKNISELSEIPDEDFPEIMPMRKGVNRFVVSKRKTPMERRLTSPQYRRNLPIVISEPENDSN